jgi:hypothetical protein
MRVKLAQAKERKEKLGRPITEFMRRKLNKSFETSKQEKPVKPKRQPKDAKKSLDL